MNSEADCKTGFFIKGNCKCIKRRLFHDTVPGDTRLLKTIAIPQHNFLVLVI